MARSGSGMLEPSAGLLTISRRWRPLLDVPGISSHGDWRTFTWLNKGSVQHGALLVPKSPPWRRLFAMLDEIGASQDSVPISWTDEADAITACCWRYGSYIHLLTGGELYPPFRDDSRLSRIGDSEMRRINIEFSAALAAWLATRAEEPERIARRTRAALTLLPMPWRDERQPWWAEFVEDLAQKGGQKLKEVFELHRTGIMDRTRAAMQDPLVACRREANQIVLSSYRNGPIENLHAGTWSHGSEVPGFMRLYGPEIRRLERDVSERVAIELLKRDNFTFETRMVAAASAPVDWSLTLETSHVRFLGMPGADSLHVRLQHLARRYQLHFGGSITDGDYDVKRDTIIDV